MLHNFSHKKKLKALWIAAVIMLVICYRFSISKTVGEYKLYKQNSALSLPGDEAYSAENLELKNKMLAGVLEKFVLDTADNSKNLMAVATSLCEENNLDLKEYRPNPAGQADSLKLLTRSITVQGRFIDCLKFIYHLETQSSIGHISSVLFRSYNNPGSSETNLNCTVYVQNIIP